MKIPVMGIDINYTDVGEGRPIVLLHGWGASYGCFAGIIRVLSPYFRVIAPDFPGCGESADPPCPWTNDDYADFVMAFIEAVGISSPLLVGHSHGGRVVLKLLTRGDLAPEKAVLFGSAGVVLPKSFGKRVKTFEYKTAKRILMMPGLRGRTEGLMERLRRRFGSADYASANEVMRKTMVNVISEDLRAEMPKIKTSVLLVWGENDNDTPVAAGKIMEKTIPGAGLCVLPGAGHYCFLDRPQQTAAILRSFFKEEMKL